MGKHSHSIPSPHSASIGNTMIQPSEPLWLSTFSPNMLQVGPPCNYRYCDLLPTSLCAGEETKWKFISLFSPAFSIHPPQDESISTEAQFNHSALLSSMFHVCLLNVSIQVWPDIVELVSLMYLVQSSVFHHSLYNEHPTYGCIWHLLF